MVARHVDTHLRVNGGEDVLNKAGFHCATDNQVVEFPFLHYELSFAVGVRPLFAVHRPVNPAVVLSMRHPLYGLRGPPMDLLS